MKRLYWLSALIMGVALLCSASNAAKLAYVVEVDGSPCAIRLLNLSTMKDRLVCSLGKFFPEFSSLRWSLDGRKLVFSACGKSPAGGEGLQIYSVDTTAKTPTAHWCATGSCPNVLAKGGYLHCYGRHNDAIVAGNKTIRRSESAICRLALAQDGKTYAMYVNDDRGHKIILYCDLSKQQWIAWFPINGEDEYVSGLDLSPGGKKILYGIDTGKGAEEANIYDASSGKRIGLAVESGAPFVWESSTSFFCTSFNDPDSNHPKPLVLTRYSIVTNISSKVATLHAQRVRAMAYHR